MEFLKELFTQPLSFDEFVKAVNDKGFKLADLSTGEYVAKGKLADALSKNKTLLDDIKKLEDDIEELKTSNANTEDYRKKFEDLTKKIADDKAAEDAKRADAELTDSIVASFGDKKFTSDYVKNGLIADMKTEIAKPENKGKGYAEIFDALTKDKEGIFANPNPPAGMTGMGYVDTKTVDDARVRSIMGLPAEK